MIALSKSYITSLNYPVRYTSLPSGKVIVGNTPDHLTLKVSAHGYSIIKHKLSSRYIPINFSVSSFSLNRLDGIDSSVFYIHTRFSRDHITQQLGPDFILTDIKPDTLFFRFASVIDRTLPITPDVVFDIESQMILKSQPYTVPDSIMVMGPDYILDTLKAIYTNKKKLGLISKSVADQIEISKPENLSIKRDRVKVYIDIERITEKKLRLPLEVINCPESITLKTFPALIDVSCQVGLSNFPKLHDEMFRIVSDYEDPLSGTGRLEVNILKAPDFVRAVKFSPKTVEYLIEK